MEAGLGLTGRRSGIWFIIR